MAPNYGTCPPPAFPLQSIIMNVFFFHQTCLGQTGTVQQQHVESPSVPSPPIFHQPSNAKDQKSKNNARHACRTVDRRRSIGSQKAGSPVLTDGDCTLARSIGRSQQLAHDSVSHEASNASSSMGAEIN
jgi:hypothetical protein